MKTKEELIGRYETLYQDMVDSKDPYKMHVFGEAERWVFKDLAAKHPDMAENWLSHLEAIHWNNYLSEREMMNIGKRITNQDGTKGFHWDYATLEKALLRELGGKMMDEPYYNSYALATVMNMIYSDHAMSIALDLGFKTPKETPNGNMALSCYRKSVEKLKDLDRPHFVREYFQKMMYDNSPA